MPGQKKGEGAKSILAETGGIGAKLLAGSSRQQVGLASLCLQRPDLGWEELGWQLGQGWGRRMVARGAAEPSLGQHVIFLKGLQVEKIRSEKGINKN